jgi:hypothetical protein
MKIDPSFFLSCRKDFEMKRTLLVFLVFGFLFSLSACAASSKAAPTSNSSTSLSMEGQLLVGTLKLESTDLAVSSEEASQLLPLWETLQSLASSDTAAPAEIEAVVDQIKSTMTSQQLSSITAMDLTSQDLATAMAAVGASTTGSTSTTSSNANLPAMSSGNGSAAPAGGNMAGGNPPSDMGGGPVDASITGGSTGSSQPASTQSAVSQSSSSTDQVPPALIRTLVELLQKKVS